MIISHGPTGLIVKDVFNPLEIVSTEGQRIFLCCRDGGFELAVEKNLPVRNVMKVYRIQDGEIEPFTVGVNENDKDKS